MPAHADPAGGGGASEASGAAGVLESLAVSVVAPLRARGLSVATAESLTGGLLCSTLVGVPGASRVVRGGVVAYAVDVKAELLGVDPALLAAHGAVHPDVAVAMALGVSRLVHADVGLSTTGVAGPDPADGHPVGTVFVALAGPAGVVVEQLDLRGSRRAIREQTVAAALRMVSRSAGAKGEG